MGKTERDAGKQRKVPSALTIPKVASSSRSRRRRRELAAHGIDGTLAPVAAPLRAVKKQPNTSMKISALIVSLALALCTHAGAADAPPTEVVFIDHTKVADGFSKGMVLLSNSSYRVQAGRRVKTGEAEVHASDTDIFFVTEGTATMMTGGK